VLKYLKDHGVTNIATKGLDPARLVCGIAVGTVQIPHVPVVDTMGCGDIPHDAFCYYVSNRIAKYVTVIPNQSTKRPKVQRGQAADLQVRYVPQANQLRQEPLRRRNV
jgi:hypothetical protein